MSHDKEDCNTCEDRETCLEGTSGIEAMQALMHNTDAVFKLIAKLCDEAKVTEDERSEIADIFSDYASNMLRIAHDKFTPELKEAEVVAAYELACLKNDNAGAVQ